MSHKRFAERLNQALDDIEVPQLFEERVEIFAKLIKSPRFKAQELLQGSSLPDAKTLEILTAEFEVNSDWLLGKEAL